MQQQRSPQKLLVFFFFFFSTLLFFTSSTEEEEVAFSDARRLPLMRMRLAEETGRHVADSDNRPDPEEMKTKRARALIGSRPPRCERACMSCGHCEAVQVPVVPQQQQQQEMEKAVTLTAAMLSYRVDGIANYKPLSWKCRCGGTILDP